MTTAPAPAATLAGSDKMVRMILLLVEPSVNDTFEEGPVPISAVKGGSYVRVTVLNDTAFRWGSPGKTVLLLRATTSNRMEAVTSLVVAATLCPS